MISIWNTTYDYDSAYVCSIASWNDTSSGRFHTRILERCDDEFYVDIKYFVEKTPCCNCCIWSQSDLFRFLHVHQPFSYRQFLQIQIYLEFKVKIEIFLKSLRTHSWIPCCLCVSPYESSNEVFCCTNSHKARTQKFRRFPCDSSYILTKLNFYHNLIWWTCKRRFCWD